MSFIALEEDRVLAFGRDPIDFSVVTGGNVEIACLVQSQVPDIFCARLEIDGRVPGGIDRRRSYVLVLFVFVIAVWKRSLVGVGLRPGSGFGFQFVDLAIGSGGRIDRASGASLQGLHLEFFGFKN